MTRVSVYSAALVAIVAATCMTFAAILLPNWVSFSSPLSPSDRLTYSYGLHRACSSLSSGCRVFPEDKDCQGSDRYFCSLWRTTGFLMSFTAVLELAVIVAYIVIIAGGKQKRAVGWKLLDIMLVIVAVAQCGAMAIVAYLFDTDDRFFVGWRLDTSWILCTISWSVTILSAAFITLSAFIFPTEDGYELIPSERQYG